MYGELNHMEYTHNRVVTEYINKLKLNLAIRQLYAWLLFRFLCAADKQMC